MAKVDKSLILLNNALQRLGRKQGYFKNYASLWEWIFSENESIVNSDMQYFEYIKNTVIRKYWHQDIFISSAALDDIVFYVVQNFPVEEMINRIDDFVKKSYLNRNSVVIFPLHSFGFKYGGLSFLKRNENTSYKYQNFQVFSQTNSFEKSKRNILSYLDDIKLPNRKKLDIDLFKHYHVSRGLKWFENNPVMVLHFKFSQQERYDNLRFIMQKINFITNKLYFLSALANIDDKTGAAFSTRNTNNWETLDIKHFLTITTAKSSSTLNCIPVHFSDFMIYEKMHMNIDLLLKRHSIAHWERNAVDSIDNLYRGFLNYRLTNDPKYSIYYRISNSLDYFRKSIKSINKEDKIININIAFESLLLDRQEGNKKEKMLERLWKCLKGKVTKNENIKNIEEVISERNEIIHNGLPTRADIKYNDIYRTYCKFILYIHDNINQFDSKKQNYLTTFYSSL
ncbi:MAG: hypothetical protein RLZZ367_898 [Bacteroidota bacterium]|jgi:hypothetical protein